jgi:hypothetical protein
MGITYKGIDRVIKLKIALTIKIEIDIKVDITHVGFIENI